MTDSVKVRYEIDLAVPWPGRATPDTTVRQLEATDRDGLARLMLDAYVGTIDYEGETLAEAIDEVDGWLRGSSMLDDSYGAVVCGRLVSAVLVMALDDSPFIAYVMTDPEYKGAGLGRAVVDAALTRLRESSYQRVVLYITERNTASERLFASVGARRTDIN